MSVTVSPREQESAESPDARRAFRVSFKGTIVLVVFVVAMAAAIAFLCRPQSPWVEIIGQDLLRTNAPSKTIASARDAVIRKHQNWIVGEDGRQSDPSYRGGGRTWSAGPSREEIRVKATRGKTQITDKDGTVLSIETISVTDTPTLIFVDYDDAGGKQVVINELIKDLTKRGVEVRR